MGDDATLKLGSFDVSLTDKLGQGTFGVVYRGRHAKKGDVVAVKQCEIQSDQYGFMAMKEIKNFQQLENHPNIVKLRDFHYSRNAFWMVMEFCDAGDLVKYTKTTNPDMDSKINIMYQCASAIAFMHTRKHPVVHRDIKPANIMMKKEKDGKAVVKVTDFGLSKVVEDAPDPGMTMMFTTAAGTPGFMAPEFFLQEKYTASVDIFALGLVFLALLNYKEGDKELLPLSANNKKIGMIMPVGAEMAQFGKMKMPIPTLVEDEKGDSNKVKCIKELVRNMAAYERKNRMPMEEVEKELSRLGGSSEGAVAPPPGKRLADRMNADLDKEQQKYQRTRPMSESEYKDSSEDSGDVGFMLLKEALEHAVKDKMKTEDKVAVEKEMKDMPFTSLLAHVLGEERAVDKFKVGERVRVIKDADRACDLQKGHGEWNDHMKMYMGREGVVVEIVLHVVKVQFDDGQMWSYNPLILRALDEEDDDGTSYLSQLSLSMSAIEARRGEDPVFCPFGRYDVVKIPDDEDVVKVLQKNHGGWNAKMRHSLGVKGIVNRIDKDGDVFVECINGDDWTLNPEMLTRVDMSKEIIEAGDFVIVRDDKEMVKQLQDHHGGWVEAMSAGLGKSGIVQSCADGKAKVETRGRSFIWNYGTLVLVAKGEEMLRAVLKKKVVV